LLGCAPAARAQAILLPSPYVSGGYAFGGFGVGFSKHARHTHVSAYLSGGSGYYSSAYLSPYVVPYYPVGVSRVTVVQVYAPPPVVIGAPPAGFDDERPPRLPPRPPAEEVNPPDEKPLPGAAAGGFRPVRPENRAAAQKPVPPPPKPPDEPPAKPPAPKEKPPEHVPEPPRPPRPEADPRAESARLSALGKDAFAAGEYGRAAQRFRQAIQVNPRDAQAHFLLAQAEVALGKYDEAVDAIYAGLRIDPDWPTSKFRPVQLYGDNVADLPEHLKHLEDALTRQPDDAVLLFLYAYQLWFDGRQEEARRLFQRAAAVAPDKSYSERFLLARPDKPAL
jgi:hypothetical protein